MRSILYPCVAAIVGHVAADQPDSISTLKAAVQAVNLISNGLQKYISETQKELAQAEKEEQKQVKELQAIEDQKHRAEEMKQLQGHRIPRIHIGGTDKKEAAKDSNQTTEIIQSPTTTLSKSMISKTSALLVNLEKNLMSLSSVLEKDEITILEEKKQEDRKLDDMKHTIDEQHKKSEKVMAKQIVADTQKEDAKICDAEKQNMKTATLDLEQKLATSERMRSSMQFKLETETATKNRLQKKLKFIAGKNYVKENKNLRDTVEDLTKSKNSLTRTVSELLSFKASVQGQTTKCDACDRELAAQKETHGRLYDRFRSLSKQNLEDKAELDTCRNHMKGYEALVGTGDGAGNLLNGAVERLSTKGKNLVTKSMKSTQSTATGSEEGDLREELTDFLVTKPKDELIHAMVDRMVSDSKKEGRFQEGRTSAEFRIKSIAELKAQKSAQKQQAERNEQMAEQKIAAAEKIKKAVKKQEAVDKSSKSAVEKNTEAALDDMLKSYKTNVAKAERVHQNRMDKIDQGIVFLSETQQGKQSSSLEQSSSLPNDDYLAMLADEYVNGNEAERAREHPESSLHPGALAQFFDVRDNYNNDAQSNAYGMGMDSESQSDTHKNTRISEIEKRREKRRARKVNLGKLFRAYTTGDIENVRESVRELKTIRQSLKKEEEVVRHVEQEEAVQTEASEVVEVEKPPVKAETTDMNGSMDFMAANRWLHS